MYSVLVIRKFTKHTLDQGFVKFCGHRESVIGHGYFSNQLEISKLTDCFDNSLLGK